MVGLSLAICVADIMRFCVPLDRISKIVAGTKAITEADWQEIMRWNRAHYWQDNPEEGERIARELIAQGKVEQPRLHYFSRYPSIKDGCWRKDGDPIPWERV